MAQAEHYAQMLVDAGVIEPNKIDRSPFGHVLSSFLGCNPADLHPEVYKSKLSLGDKLLLCTDGLTRHLEDAMIAAISRVRNMAVVTRDEKGFHSCGVSIINPWLD